MRFTVHYDPSAQGYYIYRGMKGTFAKPCGFVYEHGIFGWTGTRWGEADIWRPTRKWACHALMRKLEKEFEHG